MHVGYFLSQEMLTSPHLRLIKNSGTVRLYSVSMARPMMIANAATRLHRSILPQNPNIAELLDASSDDMSPEDPSPKEDMFAASDKPSIIHPQLENIGFC